MVRERTGRLRVFPSVGPSLTVGPTGGLASLSLSLSLSMCLEEGQDTGREGRGEESELLQYTHEYRCSLALADQGRPHRVRPSVDSVRSSRC